MPDYTLEIAKDVVSRKYNIINYNNHPRKIQANTFAEVINTIYGFKPESGIFTNKPTLKGLTNEEEEAIHETRRRILKINKLEKAVSQF